MFSSALNSHEIHLWRTALTVAADREKELLSFLNQDELNRAQRFHFPKHRQHFIVARGMLRQLLSVYLDQPAREIHFSYTEHGKPYLADHPLQFNLSHSDEMAVYIFTQNALVGIDIEKVTVESKADVAERYFSQTEYQQFLALPLIEQARAFYRIWACKEALIKAIGDGLAFSLSGFSVPVAESYEQQTVRINEQSIWYLQRFMAHPDYESAWVSQQPITKIAYWEWTSTGIQAWA